MSYQDFLKHFDNLEICNLTPDSLADELKSDINMKWNLNIFEGQWVAGVSSGGCNDFENFHRNPQYIIHLETPDYNSDDGKCSVVIALMQKSRRYKKKIGLESLTIGFKIYSLSENDLKQKPFKAEFFKHNLSTEVSIFINYREVSARYRFLPGYYLIVPAPFDTDDEEEFLIRVFSESKNNFEEHDEKVGMGDIDIRVSFKRVVLLIFNFCSFRLQTILQTFNFQVLIGWKWRSFLRQSLEVKKKSIGLD